MFLVVSRKMIEFEQGQLCEDVDGLRSQPRGVRFVNLPSEKGISSGRVEVREDASHKCDTRILFVGYLRTLDM